MPDLPSGPTSTLTSDPPTALPVDLADLVKTYDDELVAVRRDLHRHPELSRGEVRTTGLVRDRLQAAGLEPHRLPVGTGLICDVGAGEPVVALRADLDALPVTDVSGASYASCVPGVCHACGHDVHTAVVLGAGLVLADLHREGRLPGRVRLLFQPAEEVFPGGALDVIAAGGLYGVRRVFGLHCDPHTEVGKVGLRVGAITAAADSVLVKLRGPGGHTARPHLTADLVHALGAVVTEVPAALSRRVDPRAGLSLVWGRVAAGAAPNAIPQVGELEGTLRCLDTRVWEQAPALLRGLVEAIAAPYGVQASVEHRRGVPPVMNEPVSTALLAAATRATEGGDAVEPTEQSLGGEDFAWYLHDVPGAFARLGVGCPGDPLARDLHQGSFDVDERAIAVGVRVLVAAALLALAPA